MENPTLALITSFLSMAFIVVAYFVRKKVYYLLLELLCIVFLVISYFFTAQFFAMIGLAVGLFRTVTFFIYEQKEKRAPIIWSFIFSALTIASYFIVNLWILKTAQLLDLLCLVALIMYAFIFRIRNLKIVRFTMIVPTVLSILFNVLTHAALFATLSYVFELLANIVSIFKYHVFGKKKKVELKEELTKEDTPLIESKE